MFTDEKNEHRKPTSQQKTVNQQSQVSYRYFTVHAQFELLLLHSNSTFQRLYFDTSIDAVFISDWVLYKCTAGKDKGEGNVDLYTANL